MLAERGALETLIAGWVAADGTGNVLAARRLGWVLHQRGDTAGSEAAFRRAGERGDPSAWTHLRRVCRERGDQAGAEAALGNFERAHHDLENADRRADEQGDAEAAYRNGERWEVRARTLHEQYSADPSMLRAIGREADDALNAARQAWRRAADRGSADGAYALAERYSDYTNHRSRHMPRDEREQRKAEAVRPRR